MNTKMRAAWLSLVLCTYGCGEDGFNGSSGFTGGSNLSAERYESIYLDQGEISFFTDAFTQGESAHEATEAFIQGEKFGALDLMLVVDNSGSMTEERVNLSNKLQPLLSKINRADWKIGITSTDVFQSCNFLITKQTTQPNQRFSDIIMNMGDKGDSVEAGFYKAVEGIKGTCGGQNWVRDNSTIAVLIVSDEDNCSFHGDPQNQNCRNTGSDNADYLVDYLASIRSVGTDARVYGIISEPSNPCPTAENVGVIYDQVITQTGGHTGSICDLSYSDTLTSISDNISKILNAQFSLRSKPAQNSVIVKVNDKVVSSDQYTITPKRVVFSEPPQIGDRISIAYKAAAGALARSFKLSKFAVKDGVIVTIDGITLDESQYYVDEVNQQIVFDKEPPLGAIIEVTFDPEGAAIKRFTIKKGLKVEGMLAEIGGRPVSSFKYDPRTGVIEFDQAPAAGEEIVIRHLVKNK